MTINSFLFHPDVKKALKKNGPVLAMESTILAHGMPFPENLAFAKNSADLLISAGVVPATIAIINGKIKIGLDEKDLEFVCNNPAVHKTSLRDLGAIVSEKRSGATTASATMHLAYLAGISVFSTGGIGGVHHNYSKNMDMSQDLMALSNVPIIVVSAGAKSILDLPKTLETLESFGVPVIGFKTKEFPGFYSRATGLKLNNHVKSVEEIIKQYKTSRALKINSAFLIANPIRKKDEISKKEIGGYLKSALKLADKNKISGKDVTPFLLKTIVDLSCGKCLKANISLALNNIKLGAEIATSLAGR